MKTSLILTALSLVLALPGLAAPKKTDEPAEKPAAKSEAKPSGDAKAKKNTYPLYGQVVTATSRTLTIKGGEGKEDRKYTLNAETVITKADKPATSEDIKEGQWVGGLLEKATDGNDKVVKLNLSVKQKAAKPAAKEGESTKTESKTKKKAE